jgi:hypothetical protein
MLDYLAMTPCGERFMRTGLLGFALALTPASAAVVLPATFDSFSCSSSSPSACSDSHGGQPGSFSGIQLPIFGSTGLQGAELFSVSPVMSYVVGGSGGNILTDIDMFIYGPVGGAGMISEGTAIPLAWDFGLQLTSPGNTATLDSWGLEYQIDRDSLCSAACRSRC